jgi:anti-sigma regulatory factor (Ser/Thr protein kinase)
VLDQYQRTMEDGLRQGARAFRSVGYLDLDDTDLAWSEWLRYEAAFGSLRDYPLHALCTWDLRRMSRQQIAAFRSTHPSVLGPEGTQHNPEYVDPVELVNQPEHRPQPDPAQADPPHFESVVGPDLRPLRVDIYPVTLASALPREKIDDFVKAVGGVVLNAHSHGKGPVRLRLWVQPHKLVCTVTDHGPGIGDPFVGYVQPPRNVPGEPVRTGGLGLWAARQLCDILDYGSTPDGFTVRLVAHE